MFLMALLWMNAAPVEAQARTLVRVKIGGRELKAPVPAARNEQGVLVPLEVLPMVGAEGKINAKGDAVLVTVLATQKQEALALTKQEEVYLLKLDDLAEFVNGIVAFSEAENGKITPDASDSFVYLLAKVISIGEEKGSPKIVTSFQVPFLRTLTETIPPRGVIDIVGAKLMPETVLTDTAGEASRTMTFGAQQISADRVRVLVEPKAGDAPAPNQLAPSAAVQPASATKKTELTLANMLRQVDAHYPKLIGADAERRQALARLRGARGAFDTNLRFGTNYEQYNSSGKLKEYTSNTVGAEILTRSGVTFYAGGILNTGAVKSPLSNTGDTGLYNISAKIPLLRGWNLNSREAAERQAQFGAPLADAQFADLRLDVLFSAAAQYWNWVAAARRVQVARDLLEVSQVREQQIADEVQSGIRQGIDKFEAEAEVRRRQEALAKANQEFFKEQYKLGLYLWKPDGKLDAYPAAGLTPPFTPPPTEYSEAQATRDKALAVQRRPELRSIALARSIAKVDQDIARNDLLPSVDLLVNPGVDTGYNSVGSQMKYGLQFAIPLERRTARGKLDEARLKIEKLNQEERLQRQQIETEIDAALANINQSYLRYLAATQEVDAARALEQGERDRLALGEGTLFLVNQRERATAEAKIKVINIQAEYEQAVAAYRATIAQF